MEELWAYLIINYAGIINIWRYCVFAALSKNEPIVLTETVSAVHHAQ
jgi:hypothetical protein